MNKQDFRVSLLQEVMSNPALLEKVKMMSPDLKYMSNENFARLVAGASKRCDSFIKEYGDLNGEEIIELGIKQEEKK